MLIEPFDGELLRFGARHAINPVVGDVGDDDQPLLRALEAVISIDHRGAVVEELLVAGKYDLHRAIRCETDRVGRGIGEEVVADRRAAEIPDDDLDTVGLEWMLVAQSRISTTTAGELARLIYEDKSELALDNGFASKIEQAETDKDAFINAHQGAAEYLNDDTKSFMDRYSDMMYLGAGALSVIGSIFAAIYTKITRVAPEKASELAIRILDVGERMEHAMCTDHLDELQDELDAASLYDQLEHDIIPAFYERENGIPRGWLRIVRNAIVTVAARFSARRMVKDYVDNMYAPALRSREGAAR